ncbi:MAG: hypothetical protein NXI32_22280 [bacterium]|nr:hypothetical protein [bacterium]
MASGTPFQLIDVLRQHEVPFVIIGGHAVNFHGYIRATEDTDIVFVRNPESERRLLRALQDVNACWIGDEIDPQTGLEKEYPVTEEYILANRLMMLTTDLGYLDIFDYVPGLPEIPPERLFQDAVATDLGSFVSLRALRQMKLASGRPIDRVDLEKLPSGDE